MAQSMGIGPIIGGGDTIFKRENRWMLEIGIGRTDANGINGIVGNGVNLLPPIKSNRPSLSFKEIEIEHVSETIFMPTKAQWKPLKVTVYDYAFNLKNNLVFDWITRYYHAQNASYSFVAFPNSANFKKQAAISLYSGDGCCIETWNLDNCYPKDIDFGELSMESSAIITINMELRFDRAFVSVFQENSRFVNTGVACIEDGKGKCN